MGDPSFQKRPYQLFVSYSHEDQGIVGELVRWFESGAGVKVWWDDRRLPVGSTIASALPAAIKLAQAAVFVISRASVRSGWVREEFGAALLQRTKCKDYRIIVIRIDDVPVPDFLQTTKWIEMPGGSFDPKIALELLIALHPSDVSSSPRDSTDVYVSRSWRAHEAANADKACVFFCQEGFRLIGDALDQKVFDADKRVRSIMASCGAMIALIPDRGGGQTSPFILTEIALAAELGLPYLLVAESGVTLDNGLVGKALDARVYSLSELVCTPNLATAMADTLREHFLRPIAPHYAFYATSLIAGGSVNDYVCRVVELVAGIECVMGQNLYGQHAQREIIDRIARALFVLADVSEDNKNTLIEAGIARGAGTRLHLLAQGEPRATRFMFRDLEVSFYKDAIELLGIAHRLAYLYRRRILNRELAEV